ncbi:MAG: hypothetical protein ABI620_05640 [Chloroflexota bacterium]
MDPRLTANPGSRAAVVWLDRSHALVARAPQGHANITEIDRASDPEPSYLLRIIHEAAGCDRLVVMGPDASRVAFEREYVSIYHRPDRLIDVGQVAAPRNADLIEALRMLEPSLAAVN